MVSKYRAMKFSKLTLLFESPKKTADWRQCFHESETWSLFYNSSWQGALSYLYKSGIRPVVLHPPWKPLRHTSDVIDHINSVPSPPVHDRLDRGLIDPNLRSYASEFLCNGHYRLVYNERRERNFNEKTLRVCSDSHFVYRTRGVSVTLSQKITFFDGP